MCFTNSGCFLCANIQSCFLTPPPLPRLLCSISQTGCISLPCLEWNAEKERESTRWAEGGVEVGLCTKPKFDSLVHCRQGAEPLLSSFLSGLFFFFLIYSHLCFPFFIYISCSLFFTSLLVFSCHPVSSGLASGQVFSSCFVSFLLFLFCLVSGLPVLSRLFLFCLVSSLLSRLVSSFLVL